MAKQAQLKRSGAAAAKRPAPRQQPPAPPITVSGRWLAKAFLIVVAAAALCAYGTLCLLFYQGQWQMVLHPSRTITTTPASRGVKFDEIHFDTTETGAAKLDGWWIPADPASRWTSGTILYLHGADGSLSNAVDDLARLHALGINVFALDYRGFGRSAGIRPSERRMDEDADAAWKYLTEVRHIGSGAIVIYGSGVGASIAAELAAKHVPAGVVLDSPGPSGKAVMAQDARTKILPLWLLQRERFDPADVLRSATWPKLFLDRSEAQARTGELYRAAALPKEYFELRQSGYDATLQRFLDGVLH